MDGMNSPAEHQEDFFGVYSVTLVNQINSYIQDANRCRISLQRRYSLDQ
jgi:hypothetical protein